jgi:phospholipase/carboxylesterase
LAGEFRLNTKTDLSFIHRFEAATNPAAPILLLLHGTGGDENTLAPLGRAIAPGAALLSPRGKVMEHGMARFFRRLPHGIFDQEDLALRTNDLAQFVDASAKTYCFSTSRLIAVGFSNGANIATSLLLRYPGTMAGAIVLRGMVPFVPESRVDLNRKPVLVASGIDDPIVGTDEVEELADIFRAANADLTLHWEKSGHILSQGDVLMAFDWLRRFYGAKESTAK